MSSVPASRDPEPISRGKFNRLPCTAAESTLCVLDGNGLRDHRPARPTLTPHIRFLSIGSHVCSALPSDPALRRRPCASLTLHLHQVGWRTFTSKLSNTLGTPGGAPMPQFGMYAIMANPALHPQALGGVLVGVSRRD